MESAEKRLRRGSEPTLELPLSPHAAHCSPSSRTEVLGDLHHRLEEVQLDPHVPGKPPRTATEPSPPSEIMAWRALDLKFKVDVDDGQVIHGEETDCDDGGDDDDDHDGHGTKTNCGRKINCPGRSKDYSDVCDAIIARDIELECMDRYCERMGAYSDVCDAIIAREDYGCPFPPYPLKEFPPATPRCFKDGCCYHSAYKTHDTSTTPSTLGYRKPQHMLQFFSLCLSSSEPSYPVSVYGILAVRDDLDKRRNYVFNCPRNAAVGIGKKDSFILPLCSPCRGMYALERSFLEVDLWVKKEGDGSDDKHILSTYAEIEVRAQVDDMLVGRIPGDDCNLDLGFKILAQSVEAVIQVYAKVDHPHNVRFTALTTAYDDHEIVLFDDKLFGTAEKLLQHIVAVKKNANLDVLLRVDESQFQWTFQDEHVGAIASPDDSILEYGQFFVRVLFAPKNSE